MGTAADTATAAREQFMHRAITLARRSLAAGGPPVGAVLVRDGAIVAEAQNAVIPQTDVTAHAEMMLLREACRDQRRLHLSGDELYVTVEPCMMCFGACAYAGIASIYFGAPIADLAAITGRELAVDPGVVTKGPALHGGLCGKECSALLSEWQQARNVQSGVAGTTGKQSG
ncbi:MAG: nucleoside deaminase [Gammaproteobacteria bacterium]|nr:nucleoside deaminase [Gammaproteobacteria bacterium]